MIKANLHLHTGDDTRDNLRYSTYEAIDAAAKNDFGALALTCHQKLVYKKEYIDYAAQKNILLIPGIEAKIEKKDVIILNLPCRQADCDKKIEEIKTFPQLKQYKRNNPQIFIMAPHPFLLDYSRVSLGRKLIKNIDLFDAIEMTPFSGKLFNFNRKAEKIAKKYNKPFVATSDTHELKRLNKSYTLVGAENKNVNEFLQAIKENKIKNHHEDMTAWEMVKYRLRGVFKKKK